MIEASNNVSAPACRLNQQQKTINKPRRESIKEKWSVMGVQKYKPKLTPRTLDQTVLFESSAMLIQNTKTVVEQTRKLLKESRKLVNEHKKRTAD